ncbi:MAG TPA: arylamine N-acetyltransferase [Anaerolineae bacterium]|jgi:N-hydroxyarylamine O-acetyltransferase
MTNSTNVTQTNGTQASAQATLDLDAYFQRIGYAGRRTASLDTLQAIVRRHAETIPFENLNPFLRWPVYLDLVSLQQKLVRDGRGGYCFEQNLLLGQVLQALGFQVTNLAARVMWNVPEGVITPRGHMLLRIDLEDQPYIVDAGFGGLTLTGALRLETGVEQATPHEPFRLITRGEGFVMEARLRGAWQVLYRFDLQAQLLPDYEVTNWYLSNHPTSHFIHGLMAARPDTGRRYALRNNELAVHYLDGRTERRLLTSAAELRAVLKEQFRITVPAAPELDAAWQRLMARA